jgi:hypothetical protein
LTGDASHDAEGARPPAGNSAHATGSAVSDRPPRVLIVALSDDLGCERVIPALADAGFECGLLCPKGFASTKLLSVSRHFSLPRWASLWTSTPFVRGALTRIMREWAPEFVVPLDDLTAWLLRGLAEDKRSGKTMRALLERSLGDPRGYAACVNRQAFMDLTQSLGVAKPGHQDASDIDSSLAAARRWGFPLVVKSDHTCGGVGVRLVRDEPELLSALSRVARPSFGRRLVMAVREQIRRLSGFNVDAPEGAIVQPFVPGPLAFRTAFAWKGQVLEGMSFIVEEMHPEPVGSGTVIRPIDNPEMSRSVEAIASALGYSGFLSVDFIVAERSGEAMTIELNARSIGSTHLGRLFGHDICGSAMIALGHAPPARQPMNENHAAVALFPKEIMRAPDSPYLSTPGVYHDIPASEPQLLDRYRKQAAQMRTAVG